MKLSIKQKVVALLVILILLSSTFLGLINYRNNSSVMEKGLKTTGAQLVSAFDYSMDMFLRNMNESVEMLSTQPLAAQILHQPEPDKLVDLFKNFQETHPDALNVYIGTKDKQMFLYPHSDLPEGFDPTTREWYKKAQTSKGVIWTPPYKDAGSGKIVVAAAKAVYNNDELIGVMAIDISLETMTKLVGSIKFGKTGYFLLCDAEGKVMSHPEEKLIGKEIPVERLKNAIMSKNTGDVDYVYSKDRKFGIWKTIDKTGWKLVGVMSYKEITNSTSYVLYYTLISAIIICLIAIFIGILVTGTITKSIKIILNDTMKIGEGDFTVRCNVKSRDEMGILAQTLNQMTEKLGRLMLNVKSISNSVNTLADGLASTSKETITATGEIANTIEEIARSTNEQARDTETGVRKTNELAESIDDVASSVEQITAVCHTADDINNKGIDTVKLLLEKTLECSKAAMDTNDAILAVDKSSYEIGTIIDTIEQIAGQTNLLALNASIEAARAGEAGRGFSVVAEEIRKLAEQSASATEQIRKLISSIQLQSKNAVGTVQEAKEIVKSQDVAVKETGNIFNQISDTVSKLTQKANIIKDANKRMIDRKDEILGVIESISASAQQTSASTEEISASSEQQLAIIEEVGRAAEQLNELSQKLSSEIGRFNVM